MSAADRDYWKEDESSSSSLPQWPVTYWMMAILVACYALQCINEVYAKGEIFNYLALTADALKSGYVWQLITFQFLHANTLHLIFNLVGLYMFGTTIEYVLGRKRFLIAYLGAGAVGGLLQVLLMILMPRSYGLSVVGASAGVEALFALFCLLNPMAVVNVMLVLPVRARVLLYIVTGIEMFFTIVPTRSEMGVAHAAHFGGILFATLWVRWGWHHEWNMLPGAALVDRIKGLFYRPRRSPPLKVLKGGENGRVRPTPAPPEVAAEDLPPAEFIAREVDPILDKIAAHGMASLTERERRILAAAREKVAKR